MLMLLYLLHLFVHIGSNSVAHILSLVKIHCLPQCPPQKHTLTWTCEEITLPRIYSLPRTLLCLQFHQQMLNNKERNVSFCTSINVLTLIINIIFETRLNQSCFVSYLFQSFLFFIYFFYNVSMLSISIKK